MDADAYHRYQRLIAERKRKKWVFYNGPWKDAFYNHVGDRMHRSYASCTVNGRHYQFAVAAEVTLESLTRTRQFSFVYGLRKKDKRIVHGPAVAFHRRKQGW
jgi:hypothetical protein